MNLTNAQLFSIAFALRDAADAKRRFAKSRRLAGPSLAEHRARTRDDAAALDLLADEFKRYGFDSHDHAPSAERRTGLCDGGLRHTLAPSYTLKGAK